jgi:uncharacterized membrane protein YfcA
MTVKTLLLAALAVVSLGFVLVWARHLRSAVGSPGHNDAPAPPTLFQLIVGFVTNFFDTLGIGSYAPTTAAFKLRGMVPDEKIPGTLTIGHTLPTVAQAFIFMTLVQVDGITLALMIATAVAGAYLGAGIVARWPRRNIQIGMGGALLVAAVIFSMTNLQILPGGGEALALSNTRLAVGLAGNFMLGSLMTIGIGLYAPCMVLVSLLGMSEKTAFPIMMGSCAFLMPVGSLQFVRKDSYNLRAAIGLAVGGPLAVLIAAFIVKSLPLLYVRWLVVGVVIYTASTMLRSAATERKAAAARAQMTQPA